MKGQEIIIDTLKSESKQSKLFNEIWNERPHVSELTKSRLKPKDHPLWRKQFKYLQEPRLNERLRLDKNNIILVTLEELESLKLSIKFEQLKKNYKNGV